MVDEKKWRLAQSQFEALRKNIPNSIDAGLVSEYHSILKSFEAASGEDFSSFYIPDSQINPVVTSFRVGSIRRPGSSTYSKERYCEQDFFRRKVDAVSHYLHSIEEPVRANISRDTNDYWLMEDFEIESLAAKYKIEGYADQRGSIDRKAIIGELLKRDRTLRPQKPSFPSHSIHVANMNGSVIQQGTVNSKAQTSFQRDEIESVVSQVKGALQRLPLNETDKEQLAVDVQTIQPQLQASQPKIQIVKECLRSMHAVLARAAVSTLATGLLHELSKCIAHLPH